MRNTMLTKLPGGSLKFQKSISCLVGARVSVFLKPTCASPRKCNPTNSGGRCGCVAKGHGVEIVDIYIYKYKNI